MNKRFKEKSHWKFNKIKVFEIMFFEKSRFATELKYKKLRTNVATLIYFGDTKN